MKKPIRRITIQPRSGDRFSMALSLSTTGLVQADVEGPVAIGDDAIVEIVGSTGELQLYGKAAVIEVDEQASRRHVVLMLDTFSDGSYLHPADCGDHVFSGLQEHLIYFLAMLRDPTATAAARQQRRWEERTSPSGVLTRRAQADWHAASELETRAAYGILGRAKS